MIQLSNFEKSFKSKKVFDNVNYEFKDNLFYGLIGDSGSGKTTLLRLISLLDNDYNGVLGINGQDRKNVSKKEQERIRTSTFGYVFSDARLFDYLTIKENIILPSVIQKKKYSEEHLLSLAKQRKAEDLLGRKEVSSLSQGEKQRVSILRARLLDNPVLICDEPTAHLNEELGKEITSLLALACEKEKKLVIMATHDQSLTGFFNQVLLVGGGKLSEQR